jgi:hypothetical protein
MAAEAVVMLVLACLMFAASIGFFIRTFRLQQDIEARYGAGDVRPPPFRIEMTTPNPIHASLYSETRDSAQLTHRHAATHASTEDRSIGTGTRVEQGKRSPSASEDRSKKRVREPPPSVTTSTFPAPGGANGAEERAPDSPRNPHCIHTNDQSFAHPTVPEDACLRTTFFQERPLRIFLIRHGESEANVDPSVYHTTPDHKVALTKNGIGMAKSAGDAIDTFLRDTCGVTPETSPTLMYVSPFQRTRQTATEILQSKAGQWVRGVQESPLLVEQDWGMFEGWCVVVCVGEGASSWQMWWQYWGQWGW